MAHVAATDRQTIRQMDGQKDKQTDRQTGSQANHDTYLYVSVRASRQVRVMLPLELSEGAAVLLII